MNTQLFPVELARTDDGGIRITWSDQVAHALPLKLLRQSCPCATCREKRRADAERPATLLPVVGDTPSSKPLTITAMQPVGNYAYNVAFSDGHDTGIFTFELLRALGEQHAA